MRCLYFTSRWPKHHYSAGHERIYSLIGSLFYKSYEVSVVCAEEQNQQNIKDIRQYPVQIVECTTEKLPKLPPHKMAIFDTYLTANLYADELYNRSNKTIQILDLQDRHALRQGREQRFQKWVSKQPSLLLPKGEPMWTPQKLAEQQRAINRADLVITCSDFELFHMRGTPANICSASFLYPTQEFTKEISQKLFRPFEMRKNFVFVGNMLHRPNIDAVRVLIQHIWPRVRDLGCKEQLHIYGSDFPQELYQAKSKLKECGIRLMGHLNNTQQIGKYIASLAPLRFGAGVKGKIVDSWLEHTPVVTTPIGSQGLFLETIDEQMASPRSIYYNDKVQLTETELAGQNRLQNYYQRNIFLPPDQDLTFGGLWKNYTADEFASSIVQLSLDGTIWNRLRQVGAETLIKNHSERVGNKSLFGCLATTELKLALLRQRPTCKAEWQRSKAFRRGPR